MYHAATLSERELEALRPIGDVARLGRVRAIETDRMVLDGGELEAQPDTLYIDCTAVALQRPKVVPIFNGRRITLQLVRFPQLPFSAALIGFLEATLASDEEKNSFVTPIRLPDTISDYLVALVPDIMNRQACNHHAAVRDWVSASRTDGFAKVVAEIDPNDAEKRAIMERLRDSAKAAAQNMPRLLATL